MTTRLAPKMIVEIGKQFYLEETNELYGTQNRVTRQTNACKYCVVARPNINARVQEVAALSRTASRSHGKNTEK